MARLATINSHSNTTDSLRANSSPRHTSHRRPHIHPIPSPPSHTSQRVPALTHIPSRPRPHTHPIPSSASHPHHRITALIPHRVTALTPIPSCHLPHAHPIPSPPSRQCSTRFMRVRRMDPGALLSTPPSESGVCVCVYKRRTRIKTSLNLTSTAKTHNEFAYAVMHIKHPIHSACEVALNTTLLTGYPRPSPQSGTIRTKTPSEYSSRRFGRKC